MTHGLSNSFSRKSLFYLHPLKSDGSKDSIQIRREKEEMLRSRDLTALSWRAGTDSRVLTMVTVRMQMFLSIIIIIHYLCSYWLYLHETKTVTKFNVFTFGADEHKVMLFSQIDVKTGSFFRISRDCLCLTVTVHPRQNIYNTRLSK